jgi:hypothetical protein
MKVEIKTPRGWITVEATIDENGWARVKLRHPYGIEVFKKWRKRKPEKTNHEDRQRH